MPGSKRRTTTARLAVMLLELVGACAAPTGPGPQQATFPPGQRVVRSGGLVLELAEARYDMREVALTVSLTNGTDTALTLERQGVLLAYEELEFPLDNGSAPTLTDETTLAPQASEQIELRFVIEQPLLDAATLHVMSVRRGDDWLEPLRLAVPPPAAFVQAAQPGEE